MWQTMYESDGVGLAAPQIGKNIRIFVIDGSPFEELDPDCKDFKKAFINAHILERSGDDVPFNEGCLSIPGIHPCEKHQIHPLFHEPCCVRL